MVDLENPDFLASLPRDVLKEILLTIEVSDFLDLCNYNNLFMNICNDEYFWRDRFIKDFPQTTPSYLFTWKDQYLSLYDDKNVAKDKILHDLIEEGYNIFKIYQDFYSISEINKSEIPILAIFLLPLEKAKKYVRYLFIPINKYELSFILSRLYKIPEYLEYTKKFLGGDNEILHDIPTGSDYGFRQVMIILALNDYTPEQARERLIELDSSINKYKNILSKH